MPKVVFGDFTVVNVLDSLCTAAFDEHFADENIGTDVEVLLLFNGPQKSPIGRYSPSLVYRALGVGDAFLKSPNTTLGNPAS